MLDCSHKHLCCIAVINRVKADSFRYTAYKLADKTNDVSSCHNHIICISLPIPGLYIDVSTFISPHSPDSLFIYSLTHA